MAAMAAAVWTAVTATAAAVGFEPADGARAGSLPSTGLASGGTFALADGYAGEVDEFSAHGRELLHGCHYRRCALEWQPLVAADARTC